MRKQIILAAALLTSTAALPVLPASADSPVVMVEAIQINAKPKDVFNAILKYRNSPIDHRRLIQSSPGKAVVDERVSNVPVIGTVHNVWEESEHPFNRIDYHMISSDKFKSSSGSYVITQTDPNGPSVLTLQSELDTGIHIPMAKQLTQTNSRKDMRERLAYIKKLAESNKKVAEK